MTLGPTHRAAMAYAPVLSDIYEFMLTCGLSKNDVSQISARALMRAKVKSSHVGKDRSGYLATAASVLHAWHRDRRYLNARAKPRAVRLLGPAPSVEALIRAEPGRHRATVLARRLMAQNLVIACGKNLYRPASEIALLSTFDPAAAQHVARSLSMLLETIQQNLTAPSTSLKLIERIAEVPDLPVGQIEAFRKFTENQGSNLLRTVNDWLESRRDKNSRKARQTVRAAIHVHSCVSGPKRARGEAAPS